MLGTDKLPTNQGVLVGSYAIGRAHAGRDVAPFRACAA